MAARTITVEIVGDATRLHAALDEAEKRIADLERRRKGLSPRWFLTAFERQVERLNRIFSR